VPRDLVGRVHATGAVPPTAGASAPRQSRVHRGGAPSGNLPAGHGNQVRAPARDSGPTGDEDAARRRCLRQGKGLRGAAPPSGATKQ
jgi:hypothetical protein